MRIQWQYLVLLSAFLISCQHSANNVSNSSIAFTVPERQGYVTDLDSLLSITEKHRLDSLMRQYEERTTVEIAILTFDSSYTKAENLEKFTLNVLNDWRLGTKSKNKGILIGICADYKMMRIENGYGIEAILTNEETGIVLESCFIPEFIRGDYYTGLYNGILELMTTLDQKNVAGVDYR